MRVSKKWRDLGENLTALDICADIVTLGHNQFDVSHTIKNVETGETKEIMVSPQLSVKR